MPWKLHKGDSHRRLRDSSPSSLERRDGRDPLVPQSTGGGTAARRNGVSHQPDGDERTHSLSQDVAGGEKPHPPPERIRGRKSPPGLLDRLTCRRARASCQEMTGDSSAAESSHTYADTPELFRLRQYCTLPLEFNSTFASTPTAIHSTRRRRRCNSRAALHSSARRRRHGVSDMRQPNVR